MLLIHTGNGKGKTTACIGIALRAMGHDMRVGFGQFMKRNGQAGEQRMLSSLLQDNFHAKGEGFFTNEKERERHTQAARLLLEWAQHRMADFDILILDEALYALGHALISQQELQTLINAAATHGTHLVLSGRGLPKWLREQAHTITEMSEIQHAYALGIPATKGIEY